MRTKCFPTTCYCLSLYLAFCRLDISQEEASFFTQLEETLRKKSKRKVALMDFSKKIKSGEILLSGKSYLAENYLVPLLMPVLDCTKDEEVCVVMTFILGISQSSLWLLP